MNVAFLFNSDDPKYGGSYGHPARNTVFGLGILQASDRHMKVAVGDVLIFGKAKTSAEYDALTDRVYFAGTWSELLLDRLRATFRKATVYALTFENITRQIALDLHEALKPDESYLGLLEVDLAYGPHLALFRNSMIELYRVEGTSCRVFYTMSEEDSRDDYEPEAMRRVGFSDVDWEDRGAHKTIFADFDTLEHFRRAAAFREAVALLMPGGADDASQLVMVLEDLSPKLFDSLGAAVQALAQAQTDEGVAQAALSGRRYLEQLADVLFPPRAEIYNGRKVGRAESRNRIWAYIADNVGSDAVRLAALGGEADRLVEEFNAGIHADRPKQAILQALSEAGVLTEPCWPSTLWPPVSPTTPTRAALSSSSKKW
jgi:hypothetical protein